MWILPKQLISAFVPDTEALISDLNEQSQVCEQSLLARSKPLPARTWSRKWKRDFWMQHLSGRILKPSHGDSFVIAWISSLEAIPASHLAQPESDWEQKIPVTSGLISQAELELCAPESASLKTSKDTSPSDSEQSLQNWNQWVMRCRGEYSVRLKSALHINASECLSWPTASSKDWKDSPGMKTEGQNPDGSSRKRIDQLPRAVFQYGQPDQASPNTNGSRQESCSTPTVMDASAMSSEMRPSRIATGRTTEYLARQIQWQTPTVSTGGHQQKDGSMTDKLDQQIKSWATPRSGKTTGENLETWMKRQIKGDVATMPLTAQVMEKTGNGKLNPRWVESLMGLPVGWTMPSCASPVTIEPMNCGCSETA